MALKPATPQNIDEPTEDLPSGKKRKPLMAIMIAIPKKDKEKKDKQPEGERVPGTDTFNVDKPTTPYAKGGSVGSASRRADGIAQRGKTRA